MAIDRARPDNALIAESTDVRNQYFQGDNFLNSPLHSNMGLPDADSRGIMTGITAFEAGWQVAEGIDKGDWTMAVSGAIGLALDAGAAALDPIAYVASQLFSWMLEHIEPARAALDALAGNPEMVKGYAESWQRIEQRMSTLGGEIKDASRTTGESWQGDAGDAYRKYAEAIADLCGGAAGAAHGIARLTLMMAEVVGGVRTAVRDLLAGIAGSLVSWTIEIAATVGAAAPLVAAQATSRIALIVAKVGQLLRKLSTVVGLALTLVIALKDLFDGFHKAHQELQKS